MLIESYDIAVEVSRHSAEEFEYEAIAHVPVDISLCLPYLNAELRNGTYFPDGPAFSWQRDNHRIGFWFDRIAGDHLESREEARDVVEQLVSLVNEVWEKRE